MNWMITSAAQVKAFNDAGWSSLRNADECSVRYRYSTENTDTDTWVDVEIVVCRGYASLRHARGDLVGVESALKQARQLLAENP